MTPSRRMDWECTPGDRGYFCVKDDDGPLLQGEVTRDRKEIHISADDPIEVTKMFGPLIFWSIRVTADLESCEWVIERNFGPEGEWREVHRIPGQLDSDFTDGPDE